MPIRAYKNKYPSVTTILSILRKIGLEMWFKYNTAKFCDDKSKKGKLIGTQIHDGIQSFIETGKAKVDTEYEEEVTIALQSFMKFRKEHPKFELETCELALTSEKHKFNGTIDCIGKNIILDWKTGECKDKDAPKIYDEWKYQVAAYVHLYNEVMKKKIKKCVIVAIGKDKVSYDLCEMGEEEINDCFNQAFLPCLSIVNFQKEQKRRAKEGIFYVK